MTRIKGCLQAFKANPFKPCFKMKIQHFSKSIKNKLREFRIYSFKLRAKNHSLMQRDEIHIFQMHAAWHALGDFAHR